VIRIFYNNKQYDIGVVEVKPEGGRFAPRRPEAVCIIEADVQVDFAAPADYVEPPKVFASSAPSRPAPPLQPAAAEPNLEHDSSDDERASAPKFTGSGFRVDGKSASAKQRKSLGGGTPTKEEGAGAEPPKPAFIGASGTLSGKTVVGTDLAIRSDPAADALRGNSFGPALARTAELRRAAEEREKRAALARGVSAAATAATAAPTAAPPAAPPVSVPAVGASGADGAAAEPAPVDYWGSLGGGHKLK